MIKKTLELLKLKEPETIQTHVAGLSSLNAHLANSNKTVVMREYTNGKYRVSIVKDNALDYTEDFKNRIEAIAAFEKIQHNLFRRIITKVEK